MAKSIWERKGRFLSLTEGYSGYTSQIQVPTVQVLTPGLWRIFFSARTHDRQARTLFADVAPLDGMKVLYIEYSPAVVPGGVGDFDEHGTCLGSFEQIDDRSVCYFSGVHGVENPQYQGAIGLSTGKTLGHAISSTDRRCVLRPGPAEDCLISMPCVRRMKDEYLMWYTATRYWRMEAEPTPEPCYNIAVASSPDGMTWRHVDAPAIDFKDQNEGGLARPWVLARNELYEMWFSYRGHYDLDSSEKRRYRIGYASSKDGYSWDRDDSAHQYVNPPEPGDWDCEMQCYPTVVDCDDVQYLIYCGNGYGRGGIGYAVQRSASSARV